MKPLVSILIPAYNAEKWLADTLRSALAQTWLNKEIIVVDDGSRDGTLALARSFESVGVKVATQKNSGASAARNHAFKLCQGEFIQWLDADDLLAPAKIEKQMAVFEAGADKRVLLSSGWGRFMFRTSRAEFGVNGLWEDLSAQEWLTRKLAHNLFFPPLVWLVSRELTEAAGPWDERLSLDDDGEYFCRVIMASRGIQFVPGAQSFYRMSGFGSLSNVDYSDKKLESLWLSMREHIRYLRALNDGERTRAAAVTYLGNWLHCFHPARPDLVTAAQQLASSLGGKLDLPHVRPKYAVLEKMFGYQFAARAQTFLPNVKTAVVRTVDWMWFKLAK